MSDDRRIIFSPPDITDEEIQEVCKVLKSGWITTGPETKRFEDEVAAYCGTKRAVALSSATMSMEMTYRLLGIGEGDEVITTAYTYTATASTIYHVGAKPVLVDVMGEDNPDGSPYEIDYDAVEAAITPRTKAIAPVDVAGVMCDYERLQAIAERHKDIFTPSDNPYQKSIGRIIIMADSAHGFGAVRAGVKSGLAADFTCFSFHAVKNLSTAEGGAATWREIPGVDSDEVYRSLQLLSLHGQSKDALEKNKAGSWEYDILFTGYKCNMTDIQAALGIVQMRRYGELMSRRREIVLRYDEGINKINKSLGAYRSAERMLPIKPLSHYNDVYTSSAHLYLVRIGAITHQERCDIIERMADAGVPTNVHYKPLPMLSAYRAMGYDESDYPKAMEMYRNEITLPLHTLLSDDDVDYILESFERILFDIV